MDILDINGNILKHIEGNTLKGANLYGAYLKGANLEGAYLKGAYLKGANLKGANLYGAYLEGAYLKGAYLKGAYLPLNCPEEGAFIGWKKVHDLLIKLLIPEDAKRSSAGTRKCRASKAVVLDIIDPNGDKYTLPVENRNYSPYVTYEVGKEVLPDSWDDDRWNECSHGIHFFITKQEAIDY